MSKKIVFLITVIVFFISCEKPEGEGGTSVINGKVIYFTTSYNAQTSSMDTTYYPKAGKDIYIIYSENEDNIFNDKTETDWNGNFHFQYLRKGDYTVYTYVDSVVVNEITYDFPVFKHLNISTNNSEITLEDFVIQK
ncbi:MAG: hypothetical protein HN427_05105 [Flavobacteriales bacterium]|nr:hypothetical protein [Flavobacteriales bacterium]MBT7481883.1 hypothetical protein [Flavobacteriales bacterium]